MAEAALASAGAAADKQAAYLALLDGYIAANDTKSLEVAITHVLASSSVSPTLKPVLMSHLTAALPKMAESAGEEAHVALATFFLGKINASNTRAAHDRQVRELQGGLGGLYERRGQWELAAQTLAQIPFNGVQINMTAEDKLDVYVKIAQLFLKCMQGEEAGAYINKALHELTGLQSHLERGEAPPEVIRKMKARLELCVAQRDDLAGEYGKAAKAYEKLSRNALAFKLMEGGQASLIRKAVLCALLMPAGKASKQLDVLTMDDRVNPEKTPELKEIYPVMSVMHQERIMRAPDIARLVSAVEPYQEGAVRRSIKEHNLLAASKIYSNISIAELAKLLQINASEAEQVAAGMIKERRLGGSIDQQEQFISFEDSRGGGGELSVWDAQIKGVCEATNSVMQAVQAKHQDYDLLA